MFFSQVFLSTYLVVCIVTGYPVAMKIESRTVEDRDTNAIVAFDCHSSDISFKSVSLNIEEECDEIPKIQKETDTMIQLIQKKTFKHVEFMSCFVSRSLLVHRCVTFGYYAQPVKSGYKHEFVEVTRDVCLKAIQFGTYTYEGTDKNFSDLKTNITNLKYVVIKGKMEMNGNCVGEKWGDYEDVAVEADYKLVLQTGVATLDVKTNQLILPDGYRCNYDHRICTHPTLGNVFWSGFTAYEAGGKCFQSGYDVLYEGPAKRLISENSDKKLTTTYVVNTPTKTFALETTKSKIVCSYILSATDHPALYIVSGESLIPVDNVGVNVENIDFSLYVNTKLVYIERHFKEQMISMYNSLRAEQCKQKVMVLRNLVAISTYDPQEFALAYTGTPGFIAFKRGEVIHLGKCNIALVEMRNTPECYNELPVRYNNSEYFLTPRSRVLQKVGTEVDCSSILPVMYQLRGNWYVVKGGLTEAKEPETIKAKLVGNWSYKPIGNLMTTGLYSRDEIQKYQERIMFTSEQQAISNVISLAAAGQDVNMFNVRLEKFLTTDAVDSISTKLFDGMKGLWFRFGNYMAPIMAVMFIWKILMRLVGCGTTSHLLKKEYGNNWKVLMCCCEPLAWYFLHLAGYKKTIKIEEADQPPIYGENIYPLLPTAPQPSNRINVARDRSSTPSG